MIALTLLAALIAGLGYLHYRDTQRPRPPFCPHCEDWHEPWDEHTPEWFL